MVPIQRTADKDHRHQFFRGEIPLRNAVFA